MIAGSAIANVSRKVDGSTVDTPTMLARIACEFEPASADRLMFATATSAVNGVPSWNFTSLRRLNVSAVNVGGNEIYGQSQGTNTSVTVGGLPSNGSTLYVRLWSLVGGTWFFNDYTYKAA